MKKGRSAKLPPIVEMKNIVKIYPDGTVALRGVDLKVDEGEIVGLLGENGAGKTTLMKILSGLIPPTKGEIKVKGKKVQFKSPKDALALGIGMVHQHFTLIPQFSIVENVILGYERKRFLSIDWDKAVKDVQELAKELGINVDVKTPIALLPVGVRQKVEILKMLYRGVDILILDEPTSVLTPIEVKSLFQILRKFKEEGKTIIFITHKIKEALAITDRIVVLRKGLVEGEVETSKATPSMLARMMVKITATPITKPPYKPGEPALIVKNLWVKGDLGLYAVKDLSFKVHYGEIYGIVGVEGNGQKELIEALIGLRPIEKGEIVVKSQTLTYIPADRSVEGLVPDMSVCDNSVLGLHRLFRKGKTILMDYDRVVKHTKQLVKKYDIVVTDIKLPVKLLSGGNQQKVIIARELSKKSDIILAAHPTRGLDIAATNFVRKLLVDLRNQGKAILLITADIDEALEICDRIGVIYEGTIIGEDLAERFTEERLGLLMGGVKA